MDNVKKEYDERNWVYMSDEKSCAERDEISKNDEDTLTDVDEKSDEIYQIGDIKKDDLESEKPET